MQHTECNQSHTRTHEHIVNHPAVDHIWILFDSQKYSDLVWVTAHTLFYWFLFKNVITSIYILFALKYLWWRLPADTMSDNFDIFLARLNKLGVFENSEKWQKSRDCAFVEQSSGNDPVSRVQNMKEKKYNVPCVFNISSLIV